MCVLCFSPAVKNEVFHSLIDLDYKLSCFIFIIFAIM